MRKSVAVIATGCIAVAASGTAVLAADLGDGGHGQSTVKVNRQTSVWTKVNRDAPANWSPINWNLTYGTGAQSGTTPITVHANGTVTVDLSGKFAGGPVALRILENRHLMKPGVIRVDPTTEPVVSFTFVKDGGHRFCGRNISVEWKAATGAPTTLESATAVVDYRHWTPKNPHRGCL